MNGAQALGPDRSSWLYKLGGGKSEGSTWNRRFFSLHGSVLQYFKSETLIPQRPNGAVLIDQCTVTARDESAAADGSLRWGFALVHPCGDTLVLATETKAERALWMAALQTQRPSPSQATTADGAAREADGAWPSETAAVREGEAAALETPAALAEAEARRGEAQEALSAEEAALGAARASLQSAMTASERADAQLRHARARLKVHRTELKIVRGHCCSGANCTPRRSFPNPDPNPNQVRRSLLHWRYRTLRSSFVQLVSAVYASKLRPESRPTGTPR
jgi:hypothetical protein